MRSLARLLPLLVLLALRPAASVAQAPSPGSEAVAEEAISQIRSPFCPGLMLEVCPSEQAASLRDSIRTLAAQGKSAHDIVEGVIAEYGEEWRAIPKRTGAGIWAWVMPPAVLLLGVGIVAWKLHALRRRRGAELDAPPPALSDEERARVAAAVREWEQVEETAS